MGEKYNFPPSSFEVYIEKDARGLKFNIRTPRERSDIKDSFSRFLEIIQLPKLSFNFYPDKMLPWSMFFDLLEEKFPIEPSNFDRPEKELPSEIELPSGIIKSSKEETPESEDFNQLEEKYKEKPLKIKKGKDIIPPFPSLEFDIFIESYFRFTKDWLGSFLNFPWESFEKWLKKLEEKYPWLFPILNDLGILSIAREWYDFCKDWITSKAFSVVDKAQETLNKALSKLKPPSSKITSPTPETIPKQWQEVGTETEKPEAEPSDYLPPEEDPFDQRFRLLVFEIGKSVVPGDYDLGLSETSGPKYVPAEYFRENGWICTFKFPRYFFNFLSDRQIRSMFSSDSILGLNPSLYGFDSVNSLMTSVLLSCSVRGVSLPNRMITLDDFSAGHPVGLTVPSSVRSEDWSTMSCEFIEVRKWNFSSEGLQFETLPAYVLFKSYIDYISGLGEMPFRLSWQERHKRTPLPPINSSILISVYLFSPITLETGTEGEDLLTDRREISALLNNVWVFKILAVPTKVNVGTELKYSSGHPLSSTVDFDILFYYSFCIKKATSVERTKEKKRKKRTRPVEEKKEESKEEFRELNITRDIT